jgi:acyl carrier protein
MSEEEALSNLTFKSMERDLDLDVREEDIVFINARVLGLSPRKRALLERLLTSRKSEFPVKAGGRDRRLVAYVVFRQGDSPTRSDLRHFLRERLPEYMVPGAIMVLEEMPLTANGKIDRKRLPGMTSPLYYKDAGGEPELPSGGALTPVEEIVVGIFEDVLKLNRVATADNFFEIGGHSLLATQVVSRVRNAFGVEIEMRSIFEGPTARDLAQRIEEAMKARAMTEAPQPVGTTRGGRLPLPLAQQHLLVTERLEPGRSMFSVSGAAGPEERLNLEALESRIQAKLCESLRALCKREGATLFMTLLAAFKTLLYRYTSESDIVVGTIMANGEQAEIEHPGRSFANLLPVRTDLGGNPRFTHLLKRVKDAAFGVYLRRETPLETLTEDLRLERESGQKPQFNVAFGMRNATEKDENLKKLEIGLPIEPRELAGVDLMLWLTRDVETTDARWIYRADLFNEELIKRMHSHFETILSGVISRPDALLDELEMLSEAERAQETIDRAVREEYNYSRFKNVKPKSVTRPRD